MSPLFSQTNEKASDITDATQGLNGPSTITQQTPLAVAAVDNRTGADLTSTDTRDRAVMLAGSAYEQKRVNLLG